MTLAALINGVAVSDLSHAAALNDRGLHYGHGLFETMLLVDGQVRFLEAHLERLHDGCARLGIPAPAREALLEEIAQTTRSLRSAVVKIIVTRGVGRGYRPTADVEPTRIVAVYGAPERIKSAIVARWCETRLGRNARLAGMKHLNRLEQVLAQSELDAAAFDEGLMLDTEGELVAATAGNIFVVRDGLLATPDLRYCGVAGVMRRQVLRAAAALGIAATEEPLWPHDLELASELFVTNAVRGIQSVVALDQLRWSEGPVAKRLRDALGV